MSDEQAAAGGEDTTPAATVIALDASAPESFDSAERAVASLVAAREKVGIPAESADDATAEDELSDEDNAAPPEEATGEDKEADPAEKPPLELPRSWTKDRAEIWAKLDPATQEILLEQDRKASIDVRNRQNELAEERKAVQAERAAAEKARQQYESQLPALMRELESVNQQAFSDIKSMNDVVKLQAEDPFRFQAWQVHQMRLQATKAETDRVTKENEAAQQSKWVEHVQAENAKAVEFIPELADKDKAERLTLRVARELLPDLGFKDSELAALANGKEKLSIYDHRIQRLFADSLKLRDIQNAPKAVVKPDLPPVQRPGVARAPGSDKAALVQSLTDKLSSSGSERDALELLIAKRASRRAS
ncbi:hypothetical protein ACVIYH_009109 [Bradyrhizobium diazoefficiens]